MNKHQRDENICEQIDLTLAAISVRLNRPTPGVLDNSAAILILAVSLSVYAELTMFPSPAGLNIRCNNNSGSVGLTSRLSGEIPPLSTRGEM